MLSIHDSRAARNLIGIAALGAAMLSGCQNGSPREMLAYIRHNQQIKPEPLDKPIPLDGAMAERVWPESDAMWANGKVVAWPTRFPYNYDISTQRPYPQSRLFDSVFFLYQSFRLPFTYIWTPPFQRTVYDSGIKYPPTYEAMPPLPKSRVVAVNQAVPDAPAPVPVEVQPDQQPAPQPGPTPTQPPVAPVAPAEPAPARSNFWSAPPSSTAPATPESAPADQPGARRNFWSAH